MSYEKVDAYGVPLQAFGEPTPPEFFEILGRILALNGQIEHLQNRLDHLPASETIGVKKVEQFLTRCASERTSRNAIVHSRWFFGADTADPDTILGVRYKTHKRTSGEIATVSLRDVPGSEREQDMVQYTMDDLRTLLRRTIATAQIGRRAYSEVMLTWASRQLDGPDVDLGGR